jgi:putative nucleotidyltransferase with HDIG domain
MNRAEAFSILSEYTKNANLIKHALAVEAAMRAYAEYYRADPELWGVVGLLHDFDYEQHPSAAEHPAVGASILRERGVTEEIIHAILAHAPHTGEPRDTPLKKSIFAVDELCGFIVAVALIRPNKKLEEVNIASVMKKLDQASFAAKVNRQEIQQGAAELGIPLEEHVHRTLQAMQSISEQLGL